MSKGGKALYGARAEARAKLDEQSVDVAKRDMRPARWIEDEPAGEAAASSSDGPVANDAVASASKEVKGKQQQKRLLALHEVRTPFGAVDHCVICMAPVPYVGCCSECAGLRLDIPAAEYWDTLASEAADSDSASDAEEIVDLVGDEVATPRLRRSTRTAQGRQGRPFYGDPGSGDISAQRTPVSGAAAAATPTRSQRPRVPAGSGTVSGGGRRGGARGIRQRLRVLRGRLRLEGIRCDYVDDTIVGEADDDLQTAVDTAGERCTGISQRSREMADQNMAPKKCHGLLLRHALDDFEGRRPSAGA